MLIRRAARPIVVLILLSMTAGGCGRSAKVPETTTAVGRAPVIRPDYRDCVIPPNIAPLNFVVAEQGREACVKVWAPKGEPIVVCAPDGKVQIPLEPWRELLAANVASDLNVDVYVRGDDDVWRRFETITNHIAAEPIDSHVAYRLIGPVHNVHREMSIRQRHIESFEERVILTSPKEQSHCMNCHTFANNDPERMIIHVRDSGRNRTGMIFVRDGQARMIDTRTPNNSSPAAYSSWHPSGKLIVFSVNKLSLKHHLAGQSRVVIDHNSNLGIYSVDDGVVRSAAMIADPGQLETFPAWSPDGKFLYFSRAKRTQQDAEADESTAERPAGEYQHQAAIPDDYESFQYSLVRVAFDVDTRAWGDIETVLSAEAFGKSICEPRVSPDGRFVLITATAAGTFPVYDDDSDLWMLELATKKSWRLAANSDRCESWHGWSTNGRWILFASKRQNGQLARIYFSYIDADGRSHKPVALPQEDPAFYDDFLKNFNAPEFITGWVNAENQELLAQTIFGPEDPAAADTVSGATPRIAPPSE